MTGIDGASKSAQRQLARPSAPLGVGQWPSAAALWSSATLGRPPQSALEMWLSLFPFAPLFGVRWFWLGFGPLSGDGAATRLAAPRSDVTPPGVDAAARAVRESEKLGMPAAAWSLKTTAKASDAEIIEASVAPHTAEVVDVTKALRAVAPTPNEAVASEGDDAVVEPKGLFAARPDRVDDLTVIDGVGPRLAELMNDLGVYQFEQIAGFSPAELRWLDERLYVIKGRAERDGWAESAKRAIKARG